MYTSSVTMGQLQKKLDTIGNNLANMNTTGYKRRDTTFADLLFQQVNNQPVARHEIERLTPNGIRRGSGAALAQTALRFDQGSLQPTDRLLDVAITEEGFFFEISPTEDGVRRFTRDGAFYFSPNPDIEGENHLVDSNGVYILSPQGEPISIPANFEDLIIRENGVIEVVMPGGENIAVGQLQLVQITKPQLLTALGENAFAFTNLEELELQLDDVLNEAAGANVVRQRALEMSNVDMGQEISELMLAQRSYQFNARAVSITDQMMGIVNNLR